MDRVRSPGGVAMRLMIPALFACHALGQPTREPGTTLITGIVIDSATAGPVRDVLVYLAGSPVGTTTDSAGRFSIHNLIPGTYSIVVSHLAYERVTLRHSIITADTLRLRISLKSRPVMTEGVDIYADRPDAMPLPQHLFPSGGPNSWCAYGSETEIPVGILFTEKVLYLYALHIRQEGTDRSIELWLLMYNKSDDTIRFDAGSDVVLTMTSPARKYRNLRPAPPDDSTDRALEVTEKPSAANVLSVMASQSVLFADAAFRFDLMASGTMGHPPQPWLGWLLPEEHPAGVHPKHLQRVFQESVHAGNLSRYRIHPMSGVEGTINFRFPGFTDTGTVGKPAEAHAFEYRFTIRTPTGNEEITFSAY